jgi:glycosyltransferase involved in cell wall biosynthesis
VVADDGSTDGTFDMLRCMRAGYELIWTHVNGRGSAAARNAAGRLARHQVLIFLDDDQIASPGLVAAHLEVQRGRCLVRISRKHDLPMESVLCSPLDRPVDRVLKLLWLRWPNAAEAAGRGLSSALWAADVLRIPGAQLFTSRLVRRFYELGGITVEAASRVPPRALA